jgi:bifunctional enzyme CysN/CysC
MDSLRVGVSAATEAPRLLVWGDFQVAERLRNHARKPVVEPATADLPVRDGADCAVIVVDAGHGVSVETRRYAYLASLLGIGRVLFAVSHATAGSYETVERDCLHLGRELELEQVTCLAVSAGVDDRLTAYLDRLPAQPRRAEFRLSVQSAEPMRLTGTVVSGSLSAGDQIVLAPSGAEGRVASIEGSQGAVELATVGETVTLALNEPIDAGDAELVAGASAPPQVADQLQATVVWRHGEPLLRGRSYGLQIADWTVTATVAPVKYKVNLDSFEHVAANKLERDEIGVCDLELSRPVAFDIYAENRATGAFRLIDPLTEKTVGTGMIRFALRRAHNVRWQALTVDRAARAARTRQTPCVLWFTGLSGAGKSTIANRVEVELHRRGHHTYTLDGDNVRHGLNRDLGFTDADRVENIRRVAEVARLMVDAGLIVLVAFISPFASERQMARGLFDDGQFLELFVDTPLEVAEGRDPKGLYRKARAGELRNFTGIDSAYEPPTAPDLRLDTTALSAPSAAASVIELLERRRLLAPP